MSIESRIRNGSQDVDAFDYSFCISVDDSSFSSRLLYAILRQRAFHDETDERHGTVDDVVLGASSFPFRAAFPCKQSDKQFA
jgi:hypothetical protein